MPNPASDVVAAVLAVTPADANDGTVVVGFTPVGEDPFACPEWGDPAPIAARQAAAVLRCLGETHDEITCWDVFRLADEIDPKEPRDDRR
jgi:hypothetical protein